MTVVLSDWSIIAFALYKYATWKRKSSISLKEFEDFIFRELWARRGVALCESREELLKMLKFLERLELIEMQ